MEYTYYFRSDGSCICRCDIPTDRGDYKGRGESLVKTDKQYDPTTIKYERGEIVLIEPDAPEGDDVTEDVEDAVDRLAKSYALAMMADNTTAMEQIKKEYKSILSDSMETEESDNEE